MSLAEPSQKLPVTEELPVDLLLPPEPPAGLRVYQDDSGEVLSHSRRNLPSAIFLAIWLAGWWFAIVCQIRALFLVELISPIQWLFLAIFLVPGLTVPFVLYGALFGAQELCFRFDGEITLCRRYGLFRVAKHTFAAKDVQHLTIRQAPAYTKNRNRVNHLTETSSLNIGLPDETLHAIFPNDPEMAIARYCGAKIRSAQRTF